MWSRRALRLVLLLCQCALLPRGSRLEEVEELEMQELNALRQSLLQSVFHKSRLAMTPEEKEKKFAFNEVRKAWYIHEIKERLDLGDVKEDLLTQLSALQKECPDAEEIKSQMSDFWDEVGRWARAEDLRLAMERELHKIEEAKARMNLDVEGTKSKMKEMESEIANATKVFNKDQESRLFEIVNLANRLQELKKLISTAAHSDDARALQEEYDTLQIPYKEITKDLSDSQLQQAFHVVKLKQDIEAIKNNISNDHIQRELKAWMEIPESKYNALKRQLESIKKELDVNSIESQIMSVWNKSLRDLPDMADLRNSEH